MTASLMGRGTGLWLCLLVLLLPTPPAAAHAGSTAYLFAQVEGAGLSLRWDLALRDLDLALGLDADGDGEIRWGEVRAMQAAIRGYAGSRLSLAADGQACVLRVEPGLQIADRRDGRYAVLQLRAECPRRPGQLLLTYQALFDLDASHRGLLRLRYGSDGQDSQSGSFAPDRRQLRFGAEPGMLGPLGQYLVEGIEHVLGGWDHLLFLLALFLPAALRWSGGRWQPVSGLKPVLLHSATLVTAFTLAHALTLCLVALEAFRLPSRWVESAVAASVLFAGLNNLWPMVQRRLHWLAAGFGLIHGAAIAGALLELGLPLQGRVSALLGFNLGVELAQLSLVLLLVPLGYALREQPGYRRWLLRPGSWLVTAAGLVWLIDRLFAMNWPLPI